MSSVQRRALLAMAAALVMASAANAQVRPYLGYVYPAGGQQGKTFQIKLGGQNLDGADGVVVTGTGVSGRVVAYLRKLGPQDTTLLREQMDAFKRRVPEEKWELLMKATETADTMADADVPVVSQEELARLSALGVKKAGSTIDVQKLGIDPKIVDTVTRIRTRLAEYVLRPASAAISSLVLAEITVAPDAPPGRRELRIIGDRGPSNPMVFYVGQLPEVSRAPMLTSEQQVLGKEALALRRRGDNEAVRPISVPCTVNGQIASGEVHRYRFNARSGQRLVISTSARELVPFIADAVPGWFEPVLTLYDAEGNEVAYNDRFFFNPDPLIMFDVPKDGEYVLAINDSIFRGREDFVYRVTIDQSLLVTSIFPLGARFGTSPSIDVEGWNLEGATLSSPIEDSETGYHVLKATKSSWESNRVLFAPDTLPECSDAEPNNDPEHVQKIEFPVIVNGRIDQPDDWDVFQFTGRAGETIVAEVEARRLNSMLDSLLTLTDSQGKLLAVNDDSDDPEGGTTTRYADSYLTATLPADGAYQIHLGDTTRNGGKDYVYRLRVSEPRPDFALRVVPSSVFLRSGGTDTLSVYVYRSEGFAEPINVDLYNPPAGISAIPLTINEGEPVAKLMISSDLGVKPGLYSLVVHGSATIGSEEVIYEAVPAEDRMQAFLWRHLVPARELTALVVDPSAEKPRRKRQAPPAAAPPAKAPAEKPKFTKEQVERRLRELERLFDEGLLSPEFYGEKVAECEAAQ